MLKAALKRSAGSISQAASDLHLSRQAVWARVRRHPELRAFVTEVEDDAFDLVEAAILEACRKRDGAMLRFYADRRMRSRGYGT